MKWGGGGGGGGGSTVVEVNCRKLCFVSWERWLAYRSICMGNFYTSVEMGDLFRVCEVCKF